MVHGRLAGRADGVAGCIQKDDAFHVLLPEG